MQYVRCIDAEGSGGMLVAGALYAVAMEGGNPPLAYHPGGGPIQRERERCLSSPSGFVVLSPFYTRGLRNIITWPTLWARNRFLRLRKPHGWRPPTWMVFTKLDTPPWDGEAV